MERVIEKLEKLLESPDLFKTEIRRLIETLVQEYPNYENALLKALEDEDYDQIKTVIEKIRADLENRNDDEEVREEEGTKITTTLKIGDQEISLTFVTPKKKGLAG